MKLRLLTLFVLSVLSVRSPALAQEDQSYQPVRRDALGTRLVNGATPYPVGSS
jgi:hypothetical protein